MSLICFACKQDHMKPLKRWCDVSSLEIQYDQLQKASRTLHSQAMALQKENEILREALTDIANHNTLDGDKYNNFNDAYNGVVEVAQAAILKEIIKELTTEGEG